MSQKQKKAVEKFEPSKGDESYITGVPRIPASWVKVNQKWNDCREHAQKALDTFMDMGDMLLVLREGKTDAEFGEQRKKFCPTLSRQDARRAMRMAENRERFLPMPGEPQPSISVYAELFNASDELVQKVIDETADPNADTPTVKQVREAVKAESAEEFEDQIQDKAEPIDAEYEEVSDEEEPNVVDLSLLELTASERIQALDGAELDTESALLLCGFNPYFDGDWPCTKEVFMAACNAQMYETDPVTEADALTHKQLKIFGLCRDDVLETIFGEE